MAPTRRPQVLLLATGGTLAWSTERRMDHDRYAEHGKPTAIDEVLQLLPELGDIADVDARDVIRTGSTSMHDADLLLLKQEVEQVDPARYDGVVVTHGTATLEETAFFMCVAAQPAAPVVIVGAQRPPGLLGSDALMNLYQAVLAAADPAVRAWGPLVCMNGELHDVTKGHTTALDAFRSRGGPVGRVQRDGRVVITRHPAPRLPPLVIPESTTALPRVEIAYSYLGSDGTAVRALAATGPAGIVSAGFSPGMTSPDDQRALLDAVDAGITVVQTARAANGPVVLTAAAREAGVIAAPDLNPQQARLLTATGLAAGLSGPALAERFAV